MAFEYVPERQVLFELSFQVDRGEFLAIVGGSGAGKTTLLECIAGLLTPTAGAIYLDGESLLALGSSEREHLRLERMGIVTQFGNLVNELTVLENIELPSRLLGLPRSGVRDRAMGLLARLGIEEIGSRRIWQISGGQRQRVAIARALAHRPALILADEPTGSLDHENVLNVSSMLIEEAARANAALVVSTHDHRLTNLATRVLDLESNASAGS